jgi:hypothetical protein
MFLRALVTDAYVEAATPGLSKQFKIYPLSKLDNPPRGKLEDAS